MVGNSLLLCDFSTESLELRSKASTATSAMMYSVTMGMDRVESTSKMSQIGSRLSPVLACSAASMESRR